MLSIGLPAAQLGGIPRLADLRSPTDGSESGMQQVPCTNSLPNPSPEFPLSIFCGPKIFVTITMESSMNLQNI